MKKIIILTISLLLALATTGFSKPNKAKKNQRAQQRSQNLKNFKTTPAEFKQMNKNERKQFTDNMSKKDLKEFRNKHNKENLPKKVSKPNQY